MTPQDIIDDVRRLAQDTGLLRVADTYTNATLLSFVHQVLRSTALLRPDLFAKQAVVPTTPNTVEQTLPADSVRLVEVFSVADGNALVEVSLSVINHSYPQWRKTPAGVPVNYIRNERNPNKFFLYPRPAAGIELDVEYTQSPPAYALTDSIALIPSAFQSALVVGVLMLISGIENPTMNRERYEQFQSSYMSVLGLNLQSQTMMDVLRAFGAQAQEPSE